MSRSTLGIDWTTVGLGTESDYAIALRLGCGDAAVFAARKRLRIPPAPRKRRDPAERFWEKVEKRENGCWIWMGASQRDGRGCFWSGTKVMEAYRFSWLLMYGSLPPNGLELDHLCRVPACVNPEHLEAVTTAENIRRGMAPLIVRHREILATNTCKRGHVGQYKRVGKTRPGMACAACRRDANRARKARLRGSK